jgi:integral membrane sensor domain MASE1
MSDLGIAVLGAGLGIFLGAVVGIGLVSWIGWRSKQ